MRLRFLLLWFWPGLLLPGCGPSSLAPVKGRVTCNGQPVAHAVLRFSPLPPSPESKNAGKVATASTDDNGEYVAGTYYPGDGALIGQHRVVITVDDESSLPCRSKMVLREVKPGMNEFNIELND